MYKLYMGAGIFLSFFLRLVPILIFEFLAAQSQDGRLSLTNQYLSAQFLGQRRIQFNQFALYLQVHSIIGTNEI